MLIEKTLSQFIDQAASDAPTPGGGSVAALAGSLGTALTKMVAELSFGKKAYEGLDDEVKKEFEEKAEKLESKIEKLKKIVDEDSSAFDSVMAAFKLPKETEEEKKARSEAIQEGYKIALEVPKSCADLCLEVLKLQDIFAHYGNINAITDVGVGALLAYSGLEGALLNVTINLLSIKDEAYRKNMEDEVAKVLEEGKKLKEALMATVYKRLAE